MIKVRTPKYKPLRKSDSYTFTKSKDFTAYEIYFVNYPNTEDEYEDRDTIEFWCKNGHDPLEWLNYVISIFENNGFDWTSEFYLSKNMINMISEFTGKDLLKDTFNLLEAYKEINHNSYCFRKLTELYSQLYHTNYGDNGETALELIKRLSKSL